MLQNGRLRDDFEEHNFNNTNSINCKFHVSSTEFIVSTRFKNE